jgi:hypothetical protein
MRRILQIFGVIVALLVIALAALLLPGPSGVLASLRLPDGSEYMVTQTCNWSTEPYTIAFYMRPPGGKWGWCYIDHEAPRWFNTRMTYDTNNDVINITMLGSLEASLDRKRGTFAHGRPRMSVPAPQEFRDPEFPFPK